MLGFGFRVLAGMGFMLGFGFQAWLLGLKPMGFGFRPPHVKPLQGAKVTRAALHARRAVTAARERARPPRRPTRGVICEKDRRGRAGGSGWARAEG
jgi:hypothetical protein